MHPSRALISLLALAYVSSCQQIFINNVPGYSELDTACAPPQLSTIVRDMYSGCGDQGQTTSYSCFCSVSSSYMESVISTAILSVCPGSTAAVSSASAVFHDYCQIGATIQTTSVTSASSMTAAAKTDAASTTTTSPTATASSSPSAVATSNSDGRLSRGAKVAIGVVIPVVALVVAIIVFMVMKRRSVGRRRQEQATQTHAGSEKGWRSDNNAQSQDVEGPPAYVSEMQGSQSALSELPSGKGAAATFPFEMPSTESGRAWNAVELPAGTGIISGRRMHETESGISLPSGSPSYRWNVCPLSIRSMGPSDVLLFVATSRIECRDDTTV